LNARSAGLLMYRTGPQGTEVLLAHPGGPYWARKDEGAWTLPKGECDEGEEPLAAAEREFIEETGFAVCGPFLPLGEVRQKSGKRIQAWAFAGECDPAQLQSNLFEMEWPPRSGRRQSFVEIDRAAWFSLPEARQKLIAGQLPFLDRLQALLSDPPAPRGP
jgi:predicted NUDIX family NTP pyrophosphohydrolase